MNRSKEGKPKLRGVRRLVSFVSPLLLAIWVAAGCGGSSDGSLLSRSGKTSSSGVFSSILSTWDKICCSPLFGSGSAQARPGETPQLVLSTEKQQLIGVRTEEVAVGPMRRTIRCVGRIEADERKLATVNLKLEGWIRKLFADYEGKVVRKGQPIAEIYSPELFTLQQDYLYLTYSNEYANRLMVEYAMGDRYTPVGRATAYLADPLLKKAKDRLRFWDMSDAEIKKLDETGTPVGIFIVRSPMSGYVIDKPVVEGSRIAPGDKIVDLADLSTVWVIAEVYASELPYVRVGEQARVVISHYPDREFPARVEYIYPTVSAATRTARLRFTVPNPGNLLKPKMFADVLISADLGRRLCIPEEAILDAGVSQVVYVAKGNGRFEPHRIVTGLRADGMAEVISGLKAGERIAVSGAFLLDSEAKLKGVVH